jgi:plasmid stabilization system protein ParE
MTGRPRLAFTPRARAHVLGIERWWRRNRLSAPDLFREELQRALSLVESTPTVGSRTQDAALAGVRRVPLPRCRYHLYYRVAGDQIQVLAVWHMMRVPPRL